MLSVVDLAGFGDRDPGGLSGGQRQRVALARALVNEPAVLLLDEPLSSLDRALRADLQEELQRVQREVGTTFLYVTHDQDSAMSMSDRIAVMREGRVVETGTPEALYDRPDTAFVASFLGDANVVEATVADGAATGTATGDGPVTAEAGDLRFRADAGGRSPAAGDRVTVMVRPEGVTVDPTADADGAPGEVTASAYKGFYEEYTVALDDGPELGVRTDRRRRLSVGQHVRVRVTDARLVGGVAGTGRVPVAPDGGDDVGAD
jgi:spermidine/putrescine transport system ATP-binding protein